MIEGYVMLVLLMDVHPVILGRGAGVVILLDLLRRAHESSLKLISHPR
jgi:hypothetical protein